MNKSTLWQRGTLTAVLLSLGCQIAAQMVSPSIDKAGEPFSYFSQSTDEIGTLDSISGTEVTPEGFLYTGFGELMFFLGPEKQPISARIRTLDDGYLPVVSYDQENNGLRFHFTVFAAVVGSSGNAIPVNFIQVTIQNPGHEQRAAFLTTAIRYEAEQTTSGETADNRFLRPKRAARPGDYQQPGEAFNPDWIYSFGSDSFVRNDRVLYLFPDSPSPVRSMTLRGHYNRILPLIPSKLQVTPLTPVGCASYYFPVPPGAEKKLVFKMPLYPVNKSNAALDEIRNADFEHERAMLHRTWSAIVDRGMQISTPETKVNDTFKASLVYNLLAKMKMGDDVIQTVNDFQYHRFYLRDSADFSHMYDVTGYPDIAAELLRFFPSRQQPDGNFLSQPGQFDGWGEAMWAYGAHYRMTHDKQFAARVYPSMVKAVQWLIQARAADPMHLMPATDVRDNEYVVGHLTGYNFLALDGLQAAIEIAKDLRHVEDAARFQQEYDDLHATLLKRLEVVTKSRNGYIPPALDGTDEGTDWGNLLSVTPEIQLPPNDPMVTATLRATQAKYQEGITIYNQPLQGIYLHHYLIIKNTLTELIRGEQEQAIREFYAELMHTSSTHAGFEYAIRPWGDRNFEGNLAPHGWFASEYRSLLRNMLVREQGTTLHLLSAISPAWIGAGKEIRVSQAPTAFGPISFELRLSSDTEAQLSLHTAFTEQPASIILHLPWFMQTKEVLVDGKQIPVVSGRVLLPPGVKLVSLRWHRIPAAGGMSYDETVEAYKAEYRRRYDQMIRGDDQPASVIGTH